MSERRTRPLRLPPLPPHLHASQWSPSVNQAYTIVADAYDRSNQLLRLEDGDPIRFRLHSERLTRRILPIVQELAVRVHDDRWVASCQAAFASLIDELDHATTAAEAVYVRCSSQILHLSTD